MNDKAIQTIDQSPQALLAMAVEKNMDVDKLEKLMDLQERWTATQAKKQFDMAKAKFQSECPVLERDKKIDYDSKKTGGKIKYSYAPLSSIISQIKEALALNGFSYRWSIDDKGQQGIRVTCFLTHEAGHVEQNSMEGLPDDTGAKNLIQQRGSTVTYLQRYTLIGVLGLATADTDDDGQSSSALNIEGLLEHNAAVRDNWAAIEVIKLSLNRQELDAAAETWFEFDDDLKRVLWRAPTKGGLFTTEERKTIHSDEFSKLRPPGSNQQFTEDYS